MSLYRQVHLVGTEDDLISEGRCLLKVRVASLIRTNQITNRSGNLGEYPLYYQGLLSKIDAVEVDMVFPYNDTFQNRYDAINLLRRGPAGRSAINYRRDSGGRR